MPASAEILIVAAALICLACFIKMIRSGHFFKSLSVSLLSGVGSLFAINLLSDVTGVGLCVNWFTVTFCAFSGVSGSVALLILDTVGRL